MRLNQGKILSSLVLFLTVVLVGSSIFFLLRPTFPPPRLVLLYAPCTVNKHYLAPYDRAVSFTPRLAEFAKDAVVFRRHQTEAGASGIAYASLFSGTQVDRHGVFRHPSRLSDDLYLIAEAYADNGYETVYWNGHGAAAYDLNYGQGVPAENAYRDLKARDERFLHVLDRLRSDTSYKVFIEANLIVTHGPYRQFSLPSFLAKYPAERRGMSDAQIEKYEGIYQANNLALSWAFPETVRRLGLTPSDLSEMVPVVDALYRSNVNLLDWKFGRILDAIRSRGLLDQSLIVFTADHGEALYRADQRFMWSHSADLNPDVLSVPLLLHSSDPRVRPGVYEGVTRSIDVAPTMLGLSGIDVPEGRFAGRDLSRVLTGREKAPDLLAYSHTQILPESVFGQMYNAKMSADWTMMRKFHPRPDPDFMWVALRHGDRQYQYRNLDGTEWGFEVIDLSNGEDRALAFDASDPAYAEPAKQLLDYKRLLSESYARLHEGGAVPNEKEADILRRLGYIR